jgi:hypothetical protein
MHLLVPLCHSATLPLCHAAAATWPLFYCIYSFVTYNMATSSIPGSSYNSLIIEAIMDKLGASTNIAPIYSKIITAK